MHPPLRVTFYAGIVIMLILALDLPDPNLPGKLKMASAATIRLRKSDNARRGDQKLSTGTRIPGENSDAGIFSNLVSVTLIIIGMCSWIAVSCYTQKHEICYSRLELLDLI